MWPVCPWHAVPSGPRNFIICGGIVYAVLWIYGLIIDHDGPANFVPVNTADNWLHLGLAIALVTLGLLLVRDTARPARQA